MAIRHSVWDECFRMIRDHRRELREKHGLFMTKEIHAREFVAGRGRVSDRIIGKYQRSQIFLGLLQLVARLPEVQLINVCLEKCNHKDPEMDAWNRLVNRVERTMKEFDDREVRDRERTLAALKGRATDRELRFVSARLRNYRSRAYIISDEGKQDQITKALRKMRVWNPTPSMYGAWPSGDRTRNITTSRIIEDPTFKPSDRSYFIQLVDCVAYALLKQEVEPTEHIKKYKINEMFGSTLSRVLFLPACKLD
jgi:hypothetical protein